MAIINFCNGSMTKFSNTVSILPGQDVTITCSLPSAIIIWSSPQFTTSLVLSDNPAAGATNDTRLNGAIVFNLTEGTSPCATANATIANIQESMQGFNLTCTDGTYVATLTIDVIGT